MSRINVVVSIFLLLLLGISWYIYSDKNLEITRLGDGSCIDNDAPGRCLLYMVKDFSKWHTQTHIDKLKNHALKVALESGGSCDVSVIYFNDCSWTQENKGSISTNTMREMADWDNSIHPVFSEMPSAFLCRVYFSCRDNKVYTPAIDKDFRYGNGYLE